MPLRISEIIAYEAALGGHRYSRRIHTLHMALFLCFSFIAILCVPVLLIAATEPGIELHGDVDIDRLIHPGDDFYRFANGSWLRNVAIPSDRASYDTRAMLMDKTSREVQDLITEAAASHSSRGSIAQKVGDFYGSFVDEEGIERRGLAPLEDELARITAITDKTSLSAYLGATLNAEVEGLTTNADHIFGLWVNQGFDGADRNVVHLWQGGLGMPSRESYIDSSPQAVALRGQYRAHISAILKSSGVLDADPKAERIVSLEMRIARAFAPDADAADVFKQNNIWKRGDFNIKAPGIEWAAYFQSAGIIQQPDFVVWQPSAVIGVSALVNSESVDAWKDYLRFHLIEHYAQVLPRAIASEHSSFYNARQSGSLSTADRKQIAILATNCALGQAVGQLYTQRYFTTESKDRAKAMLANLISAFRVRISKLAWMSPQTKRKALEKLAALEIGIGYPDKWVDYSSLNIVPGDALGNMRRVEAFLHMRDLARLKQRVDPIEWPINPQVPGAVIMFSPNAEFFSAAILQPPYFDAYGDAASNYGSAGAGMAHEISHSFDELGSIYDAHGRLGDWWTADDRARYHEAASKLSAQFNSYCPFPGLCVNGDRSSTENIADLAGLVVAHDAYRLSLKDQPDAVIRGLTGEQRFFLAFAQRWRRIQNDAASRDQVARDNHALGEFRADAVRNVDAWYDAYNILPGAKLYVKPEERIRIW